MLYMNTSAPPDGYANAACAATDRACLSYQFGRAAAAYSFSYANPLAPEVTNYWLDVESFNPWSSDTALNAQVVRGMIEYLQAQGKAVGIYSTSYQWKLIAGNYAPGLPIWVPGVARASEDGPGACTSAPSFGGGTVQMVQWTLTFDGDYLC
jgi:GH25 family lysozyme M1 (1,4-beta-N-acetylmuramidase)